MRVIAGTARSIQLKAPKGDNTRPTQDRIKETLFNMIQSDICDSVFVDLFAGSGGMGIEALSRGASKAYFIDNSKEAIGCIEENLKKTRLEHSATVLKNDFTGALNLINEEHVDIIFIDPPYDGGFEGAVFDKLKSMKYVDDETMIILEARIDKNFTFPSFEIIKEKKYKTNKHIFMRKI